MEKKEELVKLIEDIKVLETSVWDDSKEVEDEQKVLDLETVKLEQDINDEKDLVTGKSVYTNAPARQTALKIAMQNDETIQTRIGVIKEARNKIKMDEIELSSKLRLFSVLKRLIVPEEPVKVNVIQ